LKHLPATKIEPRHVLASGSLPAGISPGPKSTACPTGTAAIVDNTPLGPGHRRVSAPIPAVDRMLVVMNLYPLRARACRATSPRSRIALHELSFGNRPASGS